MKTTVLLAKARESVRKSAAFLQNNIPMTPELDIGTGWPGYNRPAIAYSGAAADPGFSAVRRFSGWIVSLQRYSAHSVVPEPEVPPPQEGGPLILRIMYATALP